MKNFIQKINPYKNDLLKYWWHRLAISIIFLLTISFSVFLIIRFINNIHQFSEKKNVYSFENGFSHIRKDSYKCDTNALMVVCGKIKIYPENFAPLLFKNIEAQNEETRNSLLEMRQSGYSPYSISRVTLSDNEIFLKIDKQFFIFPLAVTIIISVLSITVFLVLASLFYRMILFIILGKKYFE